MVVTLSNLNRFSQFFYHWKKKEIYNKTYVLFPTAPLVCCHTTFGNLKNQIWRKSGRKCKQKCHTNQLNFHRYRTIKPQANFECTSFIVSLIDRRSKQLKMIKSDSSVCCTLGTELTRASLTMQLTSGVSVLAHVCEQTLDTLSNFCDNNNIHSAI